MKLKTGEPFEFAGVLFRPVEFETDIPVWVAQVGAAELNLFKFEERNWRSNLSMESSRTAHEALMLLLRACSSVTCRNCRHHTEQGACKMWETLERDVPDEGHCFRWLLEKRNEEKEK